MSIPQDDNLPVGEQSAPLGEPLTIQEAHRAIGKRVDVLPQRESAIVIRVAGTGVLVRYAGDVGRRGAHHHYGWCSIDGLVRRKDMDKHRLPNWLQEAVDKTRAGHKRIPKDLHDAVRAHVYPELADTVQSIDLDERELYKVYAKERGLSTGDALPRLLRVFGDAGARLEAQYQEELQLQAELDAKVVRGE